MLFGSTQWSRPRLWSCDSRIKGAFVAQTGRATETAGRIDLRTSSPAQRSSCSLTGIRLIPPTKLECTRSTGPHRSAMAPRASNRLRIALSSSRARCAPKQRCSPIAEAEVRVRVAIDPECERVGEDLLVAIGRGIEETERLARCDASARAARSRRSRCGRTGSTGVVQRTISSTAESTSAGSRRSFRHSSGFSMKASRPPVIALRVVSLPATTSRK